MKLSDRDKWSHDHRHQGDTDEKMDIRDHVAHFLS